MKFGLSNQTDEELVENISESLPFALAYITMNDYIKFSKVAQVSVKLGDSPELPIINQLQETEVLAYLDAQK